jgi:hypothetical protein
MPLRTLSKHLGDASPATDATLRETWIPGAANSPTTPATLPLPSLSWGLKNALLGQRRLLRRLLVLFAEVVGWQQRVHYQREQQSLCDDRLKQCSQNRQQ